MEASLRFLKKDKKFAALITKHGKPELTRGTNLFQALVRSIVYQQLSGKAAGTIYGRFVALFNKPNTAPAQLKFPKPKEVLKMPLEKLRSVGLSGQKASYVLDLAIRRELFLNTAKSVRRVLTNSKRQRRIRCSFR